MVEIFERYEKTLGKVKKTSSASITCAGKVIGGSYETVSITGSGSIDGDLDAEEVKAAGSAVFRGNVSASLVSLAGAVKIEGDLKAEYVKAAGSLSLRGVLKADNVMVVGSLKAKSVQGGIINLSGAFGVEEGVEGDEIELKLSDDSSALFIKGLKVEVLRAESSILNLHRFFGLKNKRPRLRVDEIEVAELVVEDVIIEGYVKAEKVVIVGNGDVKGSIEGEIIKR